MTDDVEDDLEWEEWMALSEAEVERRCEVAMREYADLYNRLPVAEQQRHSIRMVLGTCAGWRRHIRRWDLPIFHDYLRKSQMSLVKLRAWRQTGIRPGEA